MCRLWIRRSLILTKLVARIKILPANIEVNLDSLANLLKTAIPAEMELKSHVTEPIAFGLNSLNVDIILDDSEGQMDALEESIKKVDGVGEIEVTNVSRQSVRIK
jgi:elongation factor 1-beta